jgi:hypothetical protein
MDEPEAALNLPDNCAMSALSTTEYSEKIHYEYAVLYSRKLPRPSLTGTATKGTRCPIAKIGHRVRLGVADDNTNPFSRADLEASAPTPAR